MTKRMLIDATHAEETRVAVIEDSRLVDFDYESKLRKQLKGSIFLAKVTRVEPSLQAAFVNFGGNRHGFLPFSEIHPDYFRIPIADREALLAAQKAALEEHDEEHAAFEEMESQVSEAAPASEEGAVISVVEDDLIDDVVEVGGTEQPVSLPKNDQDVEESFAPPISEEESEEHSEQDEDREVFMDSADEGESDELREDGGEDTGNGEGEGSSAEGSESGEGGLRGDHRRGGRGGRRGRGRGRGGRRMESRSRRDEIVGGDGVDSDRPFRFNLRRNYKIQEVIKRGQIMLVQVSKEERGNKGAAVTTYLSLPGRYCVLMPNSPRGGGVSRKIANFQDRRRMREILDELTVPEGMSVILRTAGLSRTKTEIKRDLDYLMRLWDNIRDLTLKSTAPALVYEEANLIKRAVRDHYGRDIDEMYVAGEEGFAQARDFMKMMMPSHIKKVQEYNDPKIPLFHHFRVENLISEIGEPTVTLRSGGYLVINPTEAMVSIDVNSGRATKERHIEETALKTNLEAADEVARQLRLRDLGGLIVIDFIDMEDRRNNRRVEQRLREALSQDRARIQIGRISTFGLLELSRQRLNPSLTESQSQPCPHCKGVGTIRTTDSAAIIALRALEDKGIQGGAAEVSLGVPSSIAIYILNNKRSYLANIEERYGFRVHIRTDESLAPSGYVVDVLRKVSAEGDHESEEGTSDESRSEPASQPLSSPGEHRPQSDRNDGGRDRDGRGGRRRRGRRGGRDRYENRDHDNNGGGYRDNTAPPVHYDDVGEMEEPSGSTLGEAEADGNRVEGSDDDRFNREENNRGRDHFQGEGRGSGDRSDRGGRRRRGGRGRNRHRNREGGEGGNRNQQGQGGGHHRHDNRPRDNFSAAPANNGNVAPNRTEEPRQNFTRSEPRTEEPSRVRDYESVNEAPTNKKKGWWNRLVE